MIMSHLDCNDMRALMHASPDFHKAYLGARDVLFTQATFRTLLLRGIDLSNIHPMIEICLQGRGSQDFGNPTKELRYILHKIFMHYSDFEPLPVIGDTGMPFLHYEECLELLQIIDIMERPVDLSFHTDIEVCVKFGKHFQRDRFKYGRHNYRLAYVGEIRGHYREISMEHVVEYGTGQPMEIFAYAAWVYWDHANGVGCDEVSPPCPSSIDRAIWIWVRWGLMRSRGVLSI